MAVITTNEHEQNMGMSSQNDSDYDNSGGSGDEHNTRKRDRSSSLEEYSDSDDSRTRRQRIDANTERERDNREIINNRIPDHSPNTQQQQQPDLGSIPEPDNVPDDSDASDVVNDSDSSIQVMSSRHLEDRDENFDLNNAFTEGSTGANSVDEASHGRSGTNNLNDTDNGPNSVQESTSISDGDSDHQSRDDSIIDVESAANSNSEVANVAPGDSSVPVMHIDLEAAEQQVVEIPDEELEKEVEEKSSEEFKAARDYKCPICFDPPTTALITPCGHVFCCECLFHMVNSSRASRGSGYCAMCRSNVTFRDVRLVILRKKRVKKI
ncbi:SUMO-targeted ubiquitin ligase complex subunit [Maudiozyma humilis]|uniref:SUMO-targeted ubiquitin ligase complex subunit n=1 Tax=Maudiozyma humilis TaxID=51915 RepID=A0AAV5RWI2_MAUHU|nr:SUMO-targeted ubiquitin ligase complex subunit [Kazachstania humilis]